MKKICCLAFLLCFVISGCKKTNIVNQELIIVNENQEEIEVIIDPLQIKAEEIASSLDDRLLASQVLICGIDGKGKLPEYMKTLLIECPAGGVMLFRYNLDSEEDEIQIFLEETSSLIKNESGISPFMAVDLEGGIVRRFRREAADLPPAFSYWELSLKDGEEEALAKIETDSFTAGSRMINLGVNLNFAPVAEYLNDYNENFLESRSYGPDMFFTAAAAAAFIRGMEQAGILCAVKHFPGSSGPDPHYSKSTLDVERAGLDSIVYPFTQLIKNGARAVMMTHTAAAAIDSEIASLSPLVMGNWLRQELGFNGIIISDDFSMAAAGGISSEKAAVLSIAAGADMVLVWPSEIRRTNQAVLSALEEGLLSRERLQDAARRIIYEKLKMGLADNGEELGMRNWE